MFKQHLCNKNKLNLKKTKVVNGVFSLVFINFSYYNYNSCSFSYKKKNVAIFQN